MRITLDDEVFDKYVGNAKSPVLVIFKTEWAGPAREFEHTLDLLDEDYPKLIFASFDIDKSPETPIRLGIRGVPTSILFVDGVPISVKVGTLGASQVSGWMNMYVNLDAYEKDEDKTGAELIGLTMVGDQLKFISLKPGQYTFLDHLGNPNNVLLHHAFESIQYKLAIDELEELINRPRLKERELQAFFERFPNFIVNDEYKTAHSQIVLENISKDKKLIPDFVLEPFDPQGLSDILDLKLPQTKVYALTKNREGYSAAILKACAQLREYAHYFNDSANRNKLYDRYRLNVFDPKMIVVIGRRGDIDPLLKRRIHQDLPNLVVKTYDDLIERVKYRYK